MVDVEKKESVFCLGYLTTGYYHDAEICNPDLNNLKNFEHFYEFCCNMIFFLIFLQADIKPETDGCNGLKYNLTTDIIESIFRTYPMGKHDRKTKDASFRPKLL